MLVYPDLSEYSLGTEISEKSHRAASPAKQNGLASYHARPMTVLAIPFYFTSPRCHDDQTSREVCDRGRQRGAGVGHLGDGAQGQLRVPQVRLRADEAVRRREVQPSYLLRRRQLQSQGRVC